MLYTHCYRDLSVCLRRPCVRFAICMTVHRSKFHLETVRLFQYKIWWTDGSDYCLMPVFLHIFQREEPMPNCMKMHHLKWNITKFSGEGALPLPQTPPQPGREYPLPGPYPPRRLRLLDACAFHGQLPPTSSDPRNAPAPVADVKLTSLVTDTPIVYSTVRLETKRNNR